MQTSTTQPTHAFSITIEPSTMPAGKLADAAIHFVTGPLQGLKLIGFGVWERRSAWEKRGGSGRNVTFPARQYSVNGERRSFALLRPISDVQAQDRVRELILDAYERHDAVSTGESSSWAYDQDGHEMSSTARTALHQEQTPPAAAASTTTTSPDQDPPLSTDTVTQDVTPPADDASRRAQGWNAVAAQPLPLLAQAAQAMTTMPEATHPAILTGALRMADQETRNQAHRQEIQRETPKTPRPRRF